MAASIKSVVELGFAESNLRESWKLNSKFFPSKIGGKPSWLNLQNLPSPAELECQICQKPRVFLMQVYAPLENIAFHRTIFIFVCKTPECLRKSNTDSFVAFRCQLVRENDFYSFDPPVESPIKAESPSADDFHKLCDLCGCLGGKNCGKCHKRNYCSVEHQRLDWKSGHKHECDEHSSSNKDRSNSFTLKEYELLREEEEYEDEDDEKSEAAKMEEYQSFVSAQKSSDPAMNESKEKLSRDLETIAVKNDKTFNKFRKRISHEPDQVLRYQRGGEPLWVSSENLPGVIPPCTCGSSRIYEFQVMPQLLNYLQLDTLEESIDWGTIAVFTCSESCDGGVPYHQEFVWKQDFSSQDARNID